ncbi:MAG: hypothetical protein AAB673_03035 [Patescibacteria group bacterium]
MGFFYHIFGVIYYVIWSVIGLLVLAALFMVVGTKPLDAFSQLKSLKANLSGVQSVVNQAGSIGDVVKNIQTGGIPNLNSLPKATQDCLKKEIGEKNLNGIVAGTIKPTPDLIFKAMGCLK